MARYRLPVLLAVGILAAAPLHAAFRYMGEWANIDLQTRGIVGFTVRMDGNQLTITMLGSCHPKPCEMGSFPLHLYASAVDKPADIRAAGAQLPTKFSESFVVLTPQTEDTLRVDVYERFTDQSGRVPFTFSETFKRR
jgi:hypothetical protein